MELIEKTIGQYLEEEARNKENHMAIEENAWSCTYAQLNQIAETLAFEMESLDIKRGTHVGIWSENSAAWVFVFLALMKRGAIPVLLNTCYKVEEIRKVLDYSDVEILYYGTGYKDCVYADMIADLHKKLPRIRYFISMNKMNDRAWIENHELGSCSSFSAMRELVNPGDTACIIFTSGTTSMPKGVMLSHYSIVNNARAMAMAMHWNATDKMCITVPLFHCFGITAGIVACLVSGMCMHIIPYFHTLHVWEAIENSHCSVLNGVPSMFLALIRKQEHKSRTGKDLKSGIIAGSAVTSLEYKEICSRFSSMHLQPAYGQTESAPCISIADWEDSIENKATSEGEVLEHIQIRINSLDYEENGQSGVCGEIQVRGYNVMQGYYKKPEENKKVFTEDGWLKTGDIGYLDECGRLRITGRLKEMIIRAGENIAPQEIEEVIRLFDGVDGVKVIGIPAEVLQEEIVACIVPKQGYPISKEALQAFVRSRLADYKVPAHVLQFTELPMNASGKIDIKQLKKLVQERICMGKK